MTEEAMTDGASKLADNIVYFARALRAAGLPVGPGSVLDAIAAVETAGFTTRRDFHACLHAIMVKRHEDTPVFDQAFRLFWRRRGYLDKLIAMMSPEAVPAPPEARKPDAGAARAAEALMPKPKPEDLPPPSTEHDTRFTMSELEILQRKDFAQMSAAEIAEAKAAIAHLRLPRDLRRTRRFVADAQGRGIDPRASFRRSLRGAGIDLARRAPRLMPVPIVAICDISGSMSDYTRIFLHFLHRLGVERRVHTFLFGTRLTNVSRALRNKDVDEALALCSAHVEDWAGGTRIASSLLLFNRLWARRVLTQGAIVLLFSDGLEREGLADLVREMDRLHRSCRRLVWLNPLLRFDRFEAKASGIRAMLPFVDAFRPVHNLDSMKSLCAALARDDRAALGADPARWLQHVA